MIIGSLMHRWLGRFGYQLSTMPSLASFLSSRKIDLVLDVGGNVGQFGLNIRKAGYRGEIISFEPVPDAADQLRQVAGRNMPWTVEQVGLGESDGELDLNVSESSVFSSFLPQTEFARDFDRSSAVAYVIKAQVRRLDNYLPRVAGKRAFLKIDAQGFEAQALSGAGACLQSVEGILLELPVQHLYQDTWQLEEAVAHLRKLGYVISQLRPVNTLPDDRASVVELDCVFRRV